MNPTTTAVHPDPALKGQKDGNCNRTACQKPLRQGYTFFNRPMNAWYCRECATLINRAAVHDKQEPFCTLDPEAGRVY